MVRSVPRERSRRSVGLLLATVAGVAVLVIGILLPAYAGQASTRGGHPAGPAGLDGLAGLDRLAGL